MTTSAGAPGTLPAQLLVLDPDFEALFAEVEQILCEALVSVAGSPAAPVPVPGPRMPARPVRWQSCRPLRGRCPGTGRATQRGPPPRWATRAVEPQ